MVNHQLIQQDSGLGPDEAVADFVREFAGRLGGSVDVPWTWHEQQLRRQTRDFITGLAGRG